MISNISQIIESVIDPKQPTLSDHVFSQDGNLRSDVRFKILAVWAAVNKIKPVARVLIVGGIATYNYTDNSDVDVTLQILKPTKEELAEAQKIAKAYNGVEHAGPHEINYFIRPDVNYSNYDSVYDVMGNQWLKGPADIGVEIDKYLDRFDEIVEVIDIDKAELLSDLADYQQLSKFGNDDLTKARERIETKLDEIEKDAQSLGDIYLEVWSARNNAFEENDLAKIKEYGSKNALPENVNYLLLRRYCYINFLHEIKKISDDGVEQDEADDLAHTYDRFNQCELNKSLDTKITEALEDNLPEKLPDEDQFEEVGEFRTNGMLHAPDWDTTYQASSDLRQYDFAPAELRNGVIMSYAAGLQIERGRAGDYYTVPEVVDYNVDDQGMNSERFKDYTTHRVILYMRGYPSAMPDISSIIEVKGKVSSYIELRTISQIS